MRAVVDEGACIGCGLCAETCPGVFEMEKDKARASSDEVAADAEASCREAAEVCPVDAIKVSE